VLQEEFHQRLVCHDHQVGVAILSQLSQELFKRASLLYQVIEQDSQLMAVDFAFFFEVLANLAL
jgi:hypothetical protein